MRKCKAGETTALEVQLGKIKKEVKITSQ